MQDKFNSCYKRKTAVEEDNKVIFKIIYIFRL